MRHKMDTADRDMITAWTERMVFVLKALVRSAEEGDIRAVSVGLDIALRLTDELGEEIYGGEEKRKTE